ncbi:tetratricopeptide repeat protein [Piscirickettsia litoralis]|uniref:Tetratricopeptide repeat protein n=1 Tax=Piscirickettsia litoralis TaxID=1891921 RepID=A0ABX3A7J5_9GAMM|nr:tetratricopeptide repeat protein [Piscirickettsia litoralis]ODN43405.1 hypothetical protein BGC07_11340 [Piscirickettsia litoralis]
MSLNSLLSDAVTFYQINDFINARQCCLKALEQNEETPQIHYVLAIIAVQERQLDLAIQSFRKVLELNPEQVEAHTGLGHVYCLQELYEKAIVEFKKVIEAHPEDVDSYFNLAHAYGQLASWQKRHSFL